MIGVIPPAPGRAQVPGPLPARARARRRLLARAALGVLGAIGGLAGVLLLGPCAAVAYWVSTDTTGPAAAGATSIPQGAAPSATVADGTAGSDPVVTLSFPVVVVPGGPSVTQYDVTRQAASGSASSSISGSCTVDQSQGTVTCDDEPPVGRWQYTDTPVLAGSQWTGPASAASAVVTHAALDVGISSPTAGLTYDAATWTAGGPIAGSVAGGQGAAVSVVVQVRDDANGTCWNGGQNLAAAFVACGSAATWVTAEGSAQWTEEFSALDFPGAAQYTVTASALSTGGAELAYGTGSAQLSFVFDDTATPSPPTP